MALPKVERVRLETQKRYGSDLTEITWNGKTQLNEELVLPESKGQDWSEIRSFFVRNSDGETRVNYLQIMPTRWKFLGKLRRTGYKIPKIFVPVRNSISLVEFGGSTSFRARVLVRGKGKLQKP